MKSATDTSSSISKMCMRSPFQNNRRVVCHKLPGGHYPDFAQRLHCWLITMEVSGCSPDGLQPKGSTTVWIDQSCLLNERQQTALPCQTDQHKSCLSARW